MSYNQVTTGHDAEQFPPTSPLHSLILPAIPRSYKWQRHFFTKILCNFFPRSMCDKSGHQDVTALNIIGLLNTQVTVIAKTKAFGRLLTTSSKANSSCKAGGCSAAKEFPAFYKARKLITIFIRVCHCVICLISRIHSTLHKKNPL